MKLALVTLTVALALVGCSRNRYGEGPAERGGRHIDNAAEKTADSAERVTNNARSAIRDTRDDIRRGND